MEVPGRERGLQFSLVSARFLGHSADVPRGVPPVARRTTARATRISAPRPVRARGTSNTRQGARAIGTEMDPSNLIRIMPAQGRNRRRYRFPHRRASAMASDEGSDLS